MEKLFDMTVQQAMFLLRNKKNESPNEECLGDSFFTVISHH